MEKSHKEFFEKLRALLKEYKVSLVDVDNKIEIEIGGMEGQLPGLYLFAEGIDEDFEMI